jgi:HSP20 family protein
MFLTKYNPNRTFDAMFDSLFPMVRSSEPGEDREAFRMPLVNINENDAGYVITMELPGVEKKDVDVSVDGKELVVTAERAEKVESEGLLRREIHSEKYKRSFTLGDTIDAESIKAKLENGVLKITLSRKPESVGRKVDVS